ncbi:MAG: phosphate propanoyltransferase [Clostridiales Family XIII bacterium]|jgi:putative phosphotransacetylase|nr:phosphate propanoyltransferase [Clostridiales Family XIII bacterium]
MQEKDFDNIISKVVADYLTTNKDVNTDSDVNKVMVGVSNRHIHLSQAHLEILFGQGHALTVKSMVGQPGQYAAEETVTLVGPKGSMNKVRVLGPVRPESQVEISTTDSFQLGIKAPIGESGKISGTPGILVVGPKGQVELKEGVMVAWRHIHLLPEDAAEIGVKDRQIVSVKVDGFRGGFLGNVLIRVSDTSAKEMHIDVDEANAFGIKNNDKVAIQLGE